MSPPLLIRFPLGIRLLAVSLSFLAPTLILGADCTFLFHYLHPLPFIFRSSRSSGAIQWRSGKAWGGHLSISTYVSNPKGHLSLWGRSNRSINVLCTQRLVSCWL